MARRPLFRAASSFAAILILAAGCGDHTPTAVQLEQSNALAASAARGPKANVVKTQFVAGSYAAVIGPQGGTIEFGIGQLVFPAGALKSPTRITATTDGSHLGVEFGPHGLVFPSSAQPRVSFHTGDILADPTSAVIVYIDDLQQVLETIATFYDIEAKAVAGKLSHFSTYAIAKD
jgi:hypothetical protein